VNRSIDIKNPKTPVASSMSDMKNSLVRNSSLLLQFEVLPLAFAVVKETARRFKENEQLEVTAQDYDRDLAAVRDGLEIKGDYAYWHNKWMAGGNLITWDMVHYDVQLIGGVHYRLEVVQDYLDLIIGELWVVVGLIEPLEQISHVESR
jgi:hypothetical protein